MKKLLLAGVLAVAITTTSAQTTKPAVKAKTGTTAKKPAAKKPIVATTKKPVVQTAKADSATAVASATPPAPAPAPATVVAQTAPAATQPAPQSATKPAAQPAVAKNPPSPKGSTSAFRGRGYAGLKAGGNYTTLVNAGDGVKTGFAPGFHGGLVFVLPMSNSVAFQPEILYNRNAMKGEDPFDPSIKATLSTSSLDIPLLFRFSFGDKTQFFFNIGPVGSYLLGVSTKVDGTTHKSDMSGLKFADRASYAAAGGIGAAFNTTGGQVFVEARGHYGLGDFSNGFYKSDVAKPLFVTLSLGYLLAL